MKLKYKNIDQPPKTQFITKYNYDGAKPIYAHTTIPYITKLKEPLPQINDYLRRYKRQEINTVGPCPSKLYRYD